MGLPKREGLSSNHPFSGAIYASFREGRCWWGWWWWWLVCFLPFFRGQRVESSSNRLLWVWRHKKPDTDYTCPGERGKGTDHWPTNFVDPPTPEEKVTQSDHRNFFGWTGCAYAVSLAVSFTQHHMLVDIQSLLLPPRKNGEAAVLHFLMTSLGQQLLRDSGLSLPTVLKSCKLMFEPPFFHFGDATVRHVLGDQFSPPKVPSSRWCDSQRWPGKECFSGWKQKKNGAGDNMQVHLLNKKKTVKHSQKKCELFAIHSCDVSFLVKQ